MFEFLIISSTPNRSNSTGLVTKKMVLVGMTSPAQMFQTSEFHTGKYTVMCLNELQELDATNSLTYIRHERCSFKLVKPWSIQHIPKHFHMKLHEL